jgi:hypothetical protein
MHEWRPGSRSWWLPGMQQQAAAAALHSHIKCWNEPGCAIVPKINAGCKVQRLQLFMQPLDCVPVLSI